VADKKGPGTDTPVRSARRLLVVLACAAAVATALAVFSATAGASSKSSGSRPLLVDVAVPPSDLDPATVCDFNDVGFANNALYVTLVQYGSKPGPSGTRQVDGTKILPYLATSWSVSPDGRTYTFHLRTNAKFPSGRRMDAAAVKYSFDRALKMNGCGGGTLLDDYFSPPLIQSIVATSRYVVAIHLRHRDPHFLRVLPQPGGAIVDKGLVDLHGGVKKNGINQWMASHSAGGGPYVLAQYQPGTQMVLKANPTFFGPPPASSEIILKFITADPTLLLNARNGAADVTLGLSLPSIHSLQSGGNLKVVANDTPTIEMVRFPDHSPPFNNLALRKALALSVPYASILSRIGYGYGNLFSGPLPLGFPYAKPSLEQPTATNVAEAHQLIQQSGLRTPISFTVTIAEGDSVAEAIATTLQSVWASIGVNVTISKLAISAFTTQKYAFKLQAFIDADGPFLTDSGYFLRYDMPCHGQYNLQQVCIPTADRLLAQAGHTPDPAAQAIWNRIIMLWKQDWPRIDLYQPKQVVVLGPKFDASSYLYNAELDMRTWKANN
jgi:peptide/nickel transport system substrate-binding protein